MNYIESDVLVVFKDRSDNLVALRSRMGVWSW